MPVRSHPFWRRDPENWCAVLLLVLFASALGGHVAYLDVPVVDDAGISVAYALTLFQGHGLRLTPASQIVEAFSNPLWTVLLGLSVPLHLNPLAFAKAVGSVFGLLALFAFAVWGPVAEGRRLRIEDAAVGIVSAVSAFAYWTASGMETALHSALLGTAGALLLRELRRGEGSASGIALGLLALTRPEAPLYIASAAVLWLSTRALQRRLPGRQEAKIAVWILVLAGSYALFRWIYFASLLPNAYYAKKFWDFDGGAYLRGFSDNQRLLCVAAGVGFAGALLGGHRTFSRAALAALFVLSGVAFILQSRGDWMREWRFIAPVVPCLGAAIAAGLSGIRIRLGAVLTQRSRAFNALLPLGVLATIAVLFAWEVRGAKSRSESLKQGPELPVQYISEVVDRVKGELRRFGELRPVVGLPDLGGLGMSYREAEVIDVGGLADYAIGRHANNYPAIEDYLLSEGPPSILDAHGPSGHLRAFPKLMTWYEPASTPALRQMGSFFVLRGLTAAEDPRCPVSKSSVMSLSGAELAQRMDQSLQSGEAHSALMFWRCARAYLVEARLPTREWRARSAATAERLASRRAQAGDLRGALSYLSFAAVVDSGSAHHRRRAEEYRAMLFPRSKK